MPCYFIYDNLKANPFALGDEPLPGFEILAWDSWTIGTMWDIGEDAGYTRIGTQKVHGQLWKLVEPKQQVIQNIREYSGIEAGTKEEIIVTVTVPIDELLRQELQATTFALSELSQTYKIIREGRWRF